MENVCLVSRFRFSVAMLQLSSAGVMATIGWR